ncbi:MAG: UxaA family hydrolase [Janthinobacterium lividum]
MSLLLLHPDDNVLVVTAALAPGDLLTVDGVAIVAASALPVGHKVARVALMPADKIYKYGAPIGSMTSAARAGDHIHLHNMKSDYIASHTRETLEGKHR